MTYTQEQIDERVEVFDSRINPRDNDSDATCADRYTAIIDSDFDCILSMSENPFHPQGVGMHGSCHADWVQECRKRGQRVEWSALPEKVQKCILQDLQMSDEMQEAHNG